MTADDIKKKVRYNYGKITRGEQTHYTSSESSCCGDGDSSFCGIQSSSELSKNALFKETGSSRKELADVLDGVTSVKISGRKPE